MIKPSLTALLLLSTWASAQNLPDKSDPDLKPFDQVITSKYKTSKGLFTLHRLGEKLYYEIPKQQLDKDFLLVTQIARTKLGAGNGGGEPVDERVVRWHVQGKKVHLQDIDYSLWADPKLPIAKAVAAANNPSVLQSFPIEALGSNGDSVLIEVSKLYVGEVVELSPKKQLGGKIFDKERSFLEDAMTFPENVEVASSLTVSNPEGPPPWLARWMGEMGKGSATVRMRFSLVKLPEKPMMPRLSDSRVGFFSTYQTDYGRTDHFVKDRKYIDRWRLEKKDPGAALSEPIKPIVFYIDPATPSQWVPYVKRGVEQWRVAFEEAGFKNAIEAREAPLDNPEWSMEDARYSVIRWVASDVANAYGPHTSDPRTGEILEADIHMFHNIMDLQRRWYFTQVSHLDSRAQRLPMPDDLMGELIEFVVAHEVGHSLGLPHNMRSSSTYPLEKVRDREWVSKMGHCPSIMDYCRFNYVAQPEDKIALKDLIPRVGPYDKFSISWGYRPIPEATTPDAEKPTLDQWARQQDSVPWYRFSNLDTMGDDPGDQTEAVGDADPVAATRLGIKNLKRIAAHLLYASAQYGDDYSEVRHFWTALLRQWSTECAHVGPLVGGVHKHNKHAGQNGPIYTYYPKSRQVEALRFLIDEVFVPQPWLMPTDLTTRLFQENSTDRVVSAQRNVLYSLVDPWKLNRMSELMLTHPQNAYAPSEFLSTLRLGFFRELKGRAAIPYSRRLLQRHLAQVYIDLSYTFGDARALGQHQLRLLRADIEKNLEHFQDGETQAHLRQLLDDLKRELDSQGHNRKGRAFTHEFWKAEPKPERGCWQEEPLPLEGSELRSPRE